MREKETTVFSYGKQVDYTRLDYRTVSIDCNDKKIKTNELRMEDEISRIFYPLTSYRDQLFRGRVGDDDEDSLDTFYVMSTLLEDAKEKLGKIVDAVVDHLGGMAYFLEILPGQLTIYDKQNAGDYAGILVEKRDDAQDAIYDLVQAAKAKGHDVEAVLKEAIEKAEAV